MRLVFILLIAFSILTSSCALIRPKLSPASLLHADLEEAFHADSEELLDRFFKTWKSSISEISPDERRTLSDTSKAVYDIFEAFYRPDSLELIANPQYGAEIYRSYPVFVIQNEIRFSVVDSIYSDKDWLDLALSEMESNNLYEGTILNFRPAFSPENREIVRLTRDYRFAIDVFLGDDVLVAGNDKMIRLPPTISDRRIQKRIDFMDSKINIWFPISQVRSIQTVPVVNSIDLNETLTAAKIFFTISEESGAAYFVYQNNQWRLVSSRILFVANYIRY